MSPPRTLQITELVQASHEGRVRDHNEDRALAVPEVIAVADAGLRARRRGLQSDAVAGDLEAAGSEAVVLYAGDDAPAQSTQCDPL